MQVKRYDTITLSRDDYQGYEDLYIPAIFAKATPRFSNEFILQISPFLLEKLSEAGYDDEDIRLEVLSAACGSMGPVILPKVMEFIDREEDTQGAWVFLWGLLRLAGQTEDQPLRNQVIQYCVEVLELADRNEIRLIDVDLIAGIIASLNCPEHLSLLKRLEKKSQGTISYGEFKEAVRILTGKQKPYHFKEMWEEPVETWLPPRWELVKKWYQKNPNIGSEDKEEFEQYRTAKLQRRFLRSDNCARVLCHCQEDAAFITENLLHYLWDYQGVALEEIDEPALEKVLLDLFPRKITAEKEVFEHVAPVVAAFLNWLEMQNLLPHGKKLANTVADWADQIVSKGMNPDYWGMGKRFSMQAQADGVDITDQKAIDRYIQDYNTQYLGSQGNTHDLDAYRPPIPIQNVESKPGRNQPCPCGSGKKYKKCCGTLDQIHR